METLLAIRCISLSCSYHENFGSVEGKDSEILSPSMLHSFWKAEVFLPNTPST